MRSKLTLSFRPAFILAAMLTIVMSPISWAESAAVTPVKDKLYADECGACHFAYQPAFLPESSWRKLMSSLDKHFGENAEVPEADHKKLSDYLVQNAGTGSQGGYAGKFIRSIKSGDTPLRISELPYFVREHREVPQRIIKSDKIGSLSRCAACHRRAADGSYREREIDVPGYGRWEDD